MVSGVGRIVGSRGVSGSCGKAKEGKDKAEELVIVVKKEMNFSKV